MSDIDHNYTEEIVCPHCGHKYSCSNELLHGNPNAGGQEECEQCGKSFQWYADFDITYCTSKIETQEVKP